MASLVDDLRALQGPYGLWEYAPHPEASRWVTLDLLRSLNTIDSGGSWIGTESRTPFAAYPRERRRY